MTSINAQELFVHELGEIYDAEKCLIEAQQEWLSTLPTKTSRGRRPGEPRAGPPALAQCRAGSSLMGQAEIKRLLRRACSGRRRPARTPSKGPSSSCGRPGRKTLKGSKGSWTRARTSSRANSPAHDEAPRGRDRQRRAMPYKQITQLPDNVKNNLPKARPGDLQGSLQLRGGSVRRGGPRPPGRLERRRAEIREE